MCSDRDERRLVSALGDHWDGCSDWSWDKEADINEALATLTADDGGEL